MFMQKRHFCRSVPDPAQAFEGNTPVLQILRKMVSGVLTVRFFRKLDIAVLYTGRDQAL